jgi:hypothetical protein
MEPEGLLPLSQETATEPDECNPQIPRLLT